MRKLLIANRGEIACRIARTAHRMGIRTVAVFGEPDRNAPHVEQCDEAVDLDGETAAETYLDIPKILAAAARTDADAIHPGYGFLSESHVFAQAVADASLVFVGPSATAMARLGSKAAARHLASAEGIAVVPGYDGADQRRLIDEARQVGLPLLIKASAGGGGRGMRVVRAWDDLSALLTAASAEALAAFGDGHLILERLVERPRHVEVQVFADHHGNVVQLGERDCTLQRRHQKVIEEAPASFLTPDTRAALHAAATRIVRAAGYSNAATVEFLIAPDGSWYLIEVNTRLQVEHPVTELVTGQDLVEWQIRIARGEPLPLRQHEIRLQGHAVELRICAEDPAEGLRPTTGRVDGLTLPEGVRIDHGLAKGLEVGPHFDSLLAKLIIVGSDQDQALRRARAALACTRIDGIVTNVPLLSRILIDPAFKAGRIDTNWLEPALADLLREETPSHHDIAVAALAHILGRPAVATDPWLAGTPWRLNLPADETVRFALADVHVRHVNGGFRVAIGGEAWVMRASWTAVQDVLAVEIDGHRRQLLVRNEPQAVLLVDRQIRLKLRATSDTPVDTADETVLRSPLPGKVVVVQVASGDRVEKGDVLVIVDAMKMEHRLAAPCAGRVSALSVVAGDRVLAGQILLEIVP